MVGLKKRQPEEHRTSKVISWRFGPIFLGTDISGFPPK